MVRAGDLDSSCADDEPRNGSIGVGSVHRTPPSRPGEHSAQLASPTRKACLATEELASVTDDTPVGYIYDVRHFQRDSLADRP